MYPLVSHKALWMGRWSRWPLSVRIPITVERVEMENFIKKFVGTSSNTSSSRIDEHLRQIQENTQNYENKLSVSIED